VISFPISPVRVGPFEVQRSLVADGWTRYSLVVEGKVLRTWLSCPSVNDCRDALMLAQMRGRATRKTVDLLLRSAELAADEAAQLAEKANRGARCRYHRF